MEVTFREYRDEDKPLLLALAKELGACGQSLDSMKRIVNAPGFFEMDLEDTLANVSKYQGKILFAEENRKTIGYIIGVIWKQSEKNKLEIGQHVLGEVLDVFVEEQFRRKGIGTKLLEKMQHYFKERGCDSIWVHLFAPNKKAHDVYEKFGFTDRSIGMVKVI